MGVLVSASLSISKVIKSIKASIIDGNGTPLLCILKFIKIDVGNVSGLNVVSAIYNEGVNIDIKNAINLIILVIDIFLVF